MAKENKQYFRHDFSASNDPNMVKLYVKGLGNEGYGIYWRLVEILYLEGGKYPMSELETLSYTLDKVDIEKIKQVIQIAFKSDKKFFYSDRVNAQLEGMRIQSENNRKAQEERWRRQRENKPSEDKEKRELKEKHRKMLASAMITEADILAKGFYDKYKEDIEG